MVPASPVPLQDERGRFVVPGTRLGHYDLLTKLGSGGMATVWLARAVREERFARLVALKTVHPELGGDPKHRELFLREAELASTIHHANVIDVIDLGEVDGVLFQVMSLVEGIDLRALTDRHGAPLPAPILASILLDALRGLHAAHESVGPDGRPRQLVHRDVSPQNILVGLDGVARVSDFGIAQSLSSYDETTTAMRGKFAYFAPEQAKRAAVDRRTDVFATGILLWEGLTGARLFRGRDPLECLELVLERVIPHPSDIRPEVDRVLGDVVLRALARDPEGRFQTAADMASALLAATRTAKLEIATDAVARFVDELVGDEIRERIRSAANGDGAPTERDLKVPGDGTVSYVSAAAPPAALPGTVSGIAWNGDSPPGASATPAPIAPASSPPRPAKSRAPIVVAALLGASVLAAAVAFFASRPDPTHAGEPATPAASAEPSANAAPEPAVVTLAGEDAGAAAPIGETPQAASDTTPGARTTKPAVRANGRRVRHPGPSKDPPFADNPFR